MWPKYIEGNQYNSLLSLSLERSGWQVKQFSPSAMKSMRRGDILHLHWPNFHYRGVSKLSTMIKSVLFLACLAFFKLIGVKVFWTVHNLWPHSTGKAPLDQFMIRLLARQCTALLSLSKSTVPAICSEYGVRPEKIYVVRHGHYQGVYGSRGRNIRRELGIPDETIVFGFVGQISPYKGVSNLLRAYYQVRSQFQNVALIVAGRLSRDMDLTSFNIHPEMGVYLLQGYISDDEMVDYLSPIDVMVLPYKNILNSGSVILSLSHGVPVVVPEFPSIREYVPMECGVLYNNNEELGLTKAMLKALTLDRAKMHDGFKRMLVELDWDRIGNDLTQVYLGNTAGQEGR